MSPLVVALRDKGVFGWGKNRDDGKQGEENMVENVVFHSLVEERK